MDARKPTVLLVDGSQSILRVMSRILEKNGYSVVAAESYDEALKKFETNSCDAALVGDELVDGRVATLLSKIRKESPKTVRILLTSSPIPQDSEPSDDNMEARLVKPVKPETLLSILQDKLNRQLSFKFANNMSSKTKGL